MNNEFVDSMKYLIGMITVAIAVIMLGHWLNTNSFENIEQERLEKRVNMLDIKIKRQDKRIEELESLLDTNRVITNYRDVYYSLIAHDIPFPKLFTRISILEKGWHYQHAPYNNIFGFNIPGLKFETKQDAVRRLKRWVDYSPPKVNESPYQFIKRRGYNPYSFYEGRVRSIKLKFLGE